MIHDDSSDDLRTKSKRALKAILAKCTHLQVTFCLRGRNADAFGIYVYEVRYVYDVHTRLSSMREGGQYKSCC